MRDRGSGNDATQLQLRRYRAASLARSHGGAAKVLKQRSKPPSVSGSRLALGALDAATGIPSIVKALRSQRGHLDRQVQPGNVLPLIAGLRGRRPVRTWVNAQRTQPITRSKEAAALGALFVSGNVVYGAPFVFESLREHGHLGGKRAPQFDNPKSFYAHPVQGSERQTVNAHMQVREWLNNDLRKLGRAGADIDVPEAIRRLNAAKYSDVFDAYQGLMQTHKPPPGGWSWK